MNDNSKKNSTKKSLFLTFTEIIALYISNAAMSVLLWMQMPDLSDCNTMKKKLIEKMKMKNYFKTLVASKYLKLYVLLGHRTANLLFPPF